jgi:cyclic pyranopterin phosphate synthase
MPLELQVNGQRKKETFYSPSSQPLVDPLGRTIDYLRFSLTDQCNFRCVYCMPPEGLPEPLTQHLTPQELQRIGRVAVGFGFRKFRFTGGEPLLRKDLEEIVEGFSQLNPRPKLMMTTNGFGLHKRLSNLKKAGLDGVNISLDSLDRKRFQRITRRDGFEEVWHGILNCLDFDLPVKINVVVIDDLQKEEVFRFVELTRELGIEVRFLEFMPLCGTGFDRVKHLSIQEVKGMIASRYDLMPIKTPLDQPAKGYAVLEKTTRSPCVKKFVGKIGFIESLSNPFCNSCSRLRVLSDGTIRPCLFSNMAFDLKPALHQKDDGALNDVFLESVFRKPRGHNWQEPGHKKPEIYPLIHNIGG